MQFKSFDLPTSLIKNHKTMKKTSSKFLATVLFLTVICFATNGQTNVSGGIYTNTTWTLANSPYIVVDTVVVFPGVTLTIEPGVIVKFANNKRLEIRNANFIAWGTSSDSITFTSNSITPTPGIWSEIFLNLGTQSNTLKFNYCNFKFANVALNGGNPNSQYSIIAKHSNFSFNNTALTSEWCSGAVIDSCIFQNNLNYGIGGLTDFFVSNCNFVNNGTGFSKVTFSSAYANITNCNFYSNQTGISKLGLCLVKDCILKFNQYGIVVGPFSGSYASIRNCVVDSNTATAVTLNDGDTLFNCTIRNNNIGVCDSMNVYNYDNIITNNIIESNVIGIKLFFNQNQIYCNKICNNSFYDLYYNVNFGNNISAPNNFWCTPDSASTSAVIYDGYDDINKGLVFFTPIDTEQCYLQTGIVMNTIPTFSFSVFPNPASDYVTVSLPTNALKAEIKIFNMLGKLEYSSILNQQKSNIDISILATGLHIVEITDGKNTSRLKLIKQQNIR